MTQMPKKRNLIHESLIEENEDDDEDMDAEFQNFIQPMEKNESLMLIEEPVKNQEIEKSVKIIEDDEDDEDFNNWLVNDTFSENANVEKSTKIAVVKPFNAIEDSKLVFKPPEPLAEQKKNFLANFSIYKANSAPKIEPTKPPVSLNNSEMNVTVNEVHTI